MYVNRPALAAIARSAAENANARRALTWGGFTAAWLGLRGMVKAGFRADDVLYPEWEAQRVEQPVFIFANGRSGTTMLHRLMSLDEEHFAGFKLYQSIFSAVTWQRAIQAVDRSPLSGVARMGVEKVNDVFFRDTSWEGIHEMGIDKEEEDETTFVYCLESPTVSLLNPFLQGYSGLTWLDARPPEDRARFMDFYEATVKKHLYSVGGNRRFLNKNVFFATRARAVLERFDDARFLYLVRHPYKALPSWLSMFYEKWNTHSPELERDSPQARELAQMGLAYYRAGLELVRDLPERNLRVVDYRQLVKDPRAVVEDIYAWMDLEMSDAYRARLLGATQKQRRYKSGHDYSLEQFGLTKDQVYEELADVFEAFDFER